MKLKITAKKRTKCSCGTWVNPGWKILWDTGTRRTSGCPYCAPKETEHPPDVEAGPQPFDAYWDFPIFHD